jgi:DNA polymerase
MEGSLSALALLQFYVDAGLDECIADETCDRTVVTEKPSLLSMPAQAAGPAAMSELNTPPPMTAPVSALGVPPEALADAQALAAAATSIDDLKIRLADFKAMPLRRTATQMVFADGNPAARIMLVGDFPSAEDDRTGRPFSATTGVLLDRMLAAIGIDRATQAYTTLMVNWRAPGGAAPDKSVIALSQPFIERHIALAAPEVVILLGGPAAQSLLQSASSITRLRGKWHELDLGGRRIPAMAMFSPDYLLTSPAQKGLAWVDLQAIRDRLTPAG